MEQYNATTGSNTRTILEMRVRNHARISAYGYGIASIELRAGLGGQNRAYWPRVALGHAKTGSLKSHEFNEKGNQGGPVGLKLERRVVQSVLRKG